MIIIPKKEVICYEPEIGEKIWDYSENTKSGKNRLVCIEHEEDSDANGSYCSECFFHFVYPSKGHIISDCSLPDTIDFKCHSSERKDGLNVIYVKSDEF